MLIAQGWFEGKVNALVLSPCQNGMDGWQVYRAIYDPSKNENINTPGIQWACLGSAHSIHTLFLHPILTEMTKWQGGDKQMHDLQKTLDSIDQQIQQITSYIQSTCVPRS